jgi:hypothetical protein
MVLGTWNLVFDFPAHSLRLCGGFWFSVSNDKEPRKTRGSLIIVGI